MTMDYNALTEKAAAFLLEHPLNHVQPQDAIREDLIGMPIYDAPIFAVAAADDPLFAMLRTAEAIHPDYPLPTDWLAQAHRVLSFFVPYTQQVRSANARDMLYPADEWLHARIEGEEMLALLRQQIRDWLIEGGHQAVTPPHDPRFTMLAKYVSNWSERHTAYICGLGTFGMSKGLITAKGMAGRLGSVITSCPLPVTQRPYGSLYEYCAGCGACAAHCPPKAIDAGKGIANAKEHPRCDAFLTGIRNAPPRGASGKRRYGCGKCQVRVPCETGIPVKTR